jgi:hypothetical protein
MVNQCVNKFKWKHKKEIEHIAKDAEKYLAKDN